MPNPVLIEIICKICGKHFEVYPSRFKQGQVKYCSTRCYAISLQGKPSLRKKRISRFCHNCNKSFEVIPAVVKKGAGLYCSLKCKATSKEQQNSMRNLRGKHLSPNTEFKKGHKLSEKALQKLSNSLHLIMKGKGNGFYNHKHSDISKRKMSEAKKGENHPCWRGGYSLHYGENWDIQRLLALERDNYTCKDCRRNGDKYRIEVHHIIPFRTFKDYKDANRLENLRVLCSRCHGKADAKVRIEEIEVSTLK